MNSGTSYTLAPERQRHGVKEQDIENALVEKLRDLKYTERPDIRDRATLEANFRQKFEALNRVSLLDSEFARLLDELVTPDVFTAARVLREKNDFTRDDGTPLSYTLVNLRDWCKNDFEVVHQLRINTDNSHHRYDVMLLINGVPGVQIELKTLSVNPFSTGSSSATRSMPSCFPTCHPADRSECSSSTPPKTARARSGSARISKPSG